MHSFTSADAVFFDLDDTLYDQLLPFEKALINQQIELEKSQIVPFYKQVRYYSDVLWKLHVKGSLNLEELRIERLTSACKDFGILLSKEKAIAIQERYEYEQKIITPFSEIPSLLKSLQDKGKVVGVITNGPVAHQMKKLIALGIDRIIPEERIFISDGIGIAKPDKRVFEYVQTKLNLTPSKCLYIGDTWENDIVPPIEAGWKCIWFNHRKRKPQTHHHPNETVTEIDELLQLK
ncbi:HAD family hydrolase [Metabacillus halosaccharovorans]|uniref:HAD family hydrolase n=1 Tax=Metabacillus halosaccharovorans TaxID=930124 RepID=UPI0014739DB0|nr:HAD family hydrolase [Metabacillus halosaccharovorans]